MMRGLFVSGFVLAGACVAAAQDVWSPSVQRGKGEGWITLTNKSAKTVRFSPFPLNIMFQYQLPDGGGGGGIGADSVWIGNKKLSAGVGVVTVPKGKSVRYRFVPQLRATPGRALVMKKFSFFDPGPTRVAFMMKFDNRNHPGAWKGTVQVDLMTDMSPFIPPHP